MSGIVATTKVTTTVTLVIPEHEARWLKMYLQNPLFPNESQEDAAMRESFSSALNVDPYPTTNPHPTIPVFRGGV